jgi:signal transduction histidine kinase
VTKFPDLAVFDALPLSFWMSSGKEDGYRIAAWNKGAQAIYCHPPEKAIGTSYLDLFVEEAVRGQSMADADAVIAGGYQHPVNCLAVDRNALGQEVILLTNVFRYEYKSKAYQAEIAVDLTPSGFLNFLDDDYRARRLGPNHKYERTLAAFVKHYTASIQRNRQQWTRTFAHEIRTHLAVMNNALSELSEEFPGILEQPRYGEIAHSTSQLWLLSENFLLSQARHFRIKENLDGPQVGLLGDALDQVVKEYTYTASTQSIEIRIRATDEIRRTPLYGTFEAFRHTLRILVSNALKHTDFDLLGHAEEKAIFVSAQRRGSAIVLRITNVGRLDDVVELFGPEGENEFRSFEGVHLGLQIAKQWVDAVGGAISVTQDDDSHVLAEVVWPFTHSERKAPV